MSSSPEYRRPREPATSNRQLRHAFAEFGIDASDFETQSDAGSPRGPPSRTLSSAKSLPTLTKTAYDSLEFNQNYDDGIQPYWGNLSPNTDHNGEAEATPFHDLEQKGESQIQIGATNETPRHFTRSRRTFDAQAVYPAEACLFVANLAQNIDDISIEKDLTRFFGQYGTVFIKVKRDRRLMPYAFAQFTERKHADFALKNAAGKELMGRIPRLEKCGGNLSYIIFRRNKRAVQYDEAHNIFSPYGKIAKIETLDYKIQIKLNVPPSMMVQYEKFDPKRDVIKSFGPSDVFIIMSYDPKIAQDPSERAPGDRTFMEQYDKNRRSIFMGNLPPHTGEHLVHRVASLCGNVISIDLRIIPDINGGSPNVYAFVEFERPNAPDEAVRQFNGTQVEGSILKVERRRTRPTRDARSYSNSLAMRPLPLVPPLRPYRAASIALALAMRQDDDHNAGSLATALVHCGPNHSRPGSMAAAPTHHQGQHSCSVSMAVDGLTVDQSNNSRIESTDEISLPLPQDIQAMPVQPEQLNPRRVFLSPNKMAQFGAGELDEYTPINSPDKVSGPNATGNNVHWGQSQFIDASPLYVSPTGSSPVHHKPNDAPVKSFAERLATSGRPTSYAFSSAAQHAVDRCEMAIEEKENGSAKGHRRGPSALYPVAPALDLEVSESDGPSEWRTTGTTEEEEGFKEKKAKSRKKLRRGCLSEQNLKLNELSDSQLNKDHKSEENLKVKKRVSFRKEASVINNSPEPVHETPIRQAPIHSPYMGPTLQTQLMPAPPPLPGGLVYVAVPYESVAAQLGTPHFYSYPSHQHEVQYQAHPHVYQEHPQVYQEHPQARYQAHNQNVYGESARTIYRAQSQVPFQESIQTPYPGYAQASYGEYAPMYQNHQVRYQGPQHVDLQGRRYASYAHPQEYREPPLQPHYPTYSNMASSSNVYMPRAPAESPHQRRQRIEAERYRRYNA
ncbi:hypothetical protein FPOAC2_05138 [Fusarium poae]|uniref:hypothetical protein n=1 Tax=Fusarium poae TaxID=36050 RepID=UPI001CE9BF8F|nr:hypothetical protein FPOAC1_005037 [Fusarium poae]KAG8671779.1 hypothetical protein FPOAC1_005037 [Fusarium poae]